MATDSRFPHMENDGFPGVDNIDVYAYENTFDYTRWKPDVRLKVCDVAWDSEYRDVPYFADDDARDSYFDSLAGLSQSVAVETHILPDGTVKLPLPFGVMSRYNYIEATYPEFTSSGQPVEYESSANRRARWFWFIEDIRSIAPNTTECKLKLDVWTTYFNSCEVPYMMLERGHWPMTRTSVEDYLSAPNAHTRYLSAPDVNYANRTDLVKKSDSIIFNEGNMYALVFCTGHVESGIAWGTWSDMTIPETDTPLTPSGTHYSNQGVPSVETFAVPATGDAGLNAFLYWLDTNVPQFKQTVQGICIVSDKLVTIGSSFDFMGFTVYSVTAGQNITTLASIGKEDFAYPAQYADIAKLYTAPYSHIEIASENGLIATCNVEDLNGTDIEIRTALSLAFPSIRLDCEINGINGTPSTYTFYNLTNRSFHVGGSWYKMPVSWDIPIFAVVQSPTDAYDVASYYDRIQADNDRKTALGNANRSAKAAQDNANDSASTDQTNAKKMNDRVQNNTNNVAETNHANERLQTAYLDAMNKAGGYQSVYYNNANDRTNTYVARQKTLANDKASSDVSTTVSLNAALAAVENESLAATTVIGGASSIAGGAISGAVGGGLAGGLAGAGAGMATGTVGGVISAATATASYPVVAGKNAAVSSLSSTAAQALEGHVETFNDSMSTATQNYNDDMNSYKLTLLHHNNTEQTSMLDKQADNTNGNLADTRADSGVVKWNAAKTKEVQDANADRTYTTATGNAETTYTATTDNATDTSDNTTKAIKNRRNQGALGAPKVYGTMQPANAVTRPMAIWANVVTQPTGAIACAGDQMLRYGYTLNQQVDISDGISLMENFTYWKASDIWLVGNKGVPEKAQERLIRAFKDGLTVWEHPSAIGLSSIYDNDVKAS